MRKNFRRLTCKAGQKLTHNKYKELFKSNNYFLEFLEPLSEEEIQEMVSCLRLDVSTTKGHLEVAPNRLYFTLEDSIVLAPRVGKQNAVLNPSTMENFEREHQHVGVDQSLVFRKRIETVYHNFTVLKQSDYPYLYGLSEFFCRTYSKSHNVIVTKRDSIVATLDKDSLNPAIWCKMERQYRRRVDFLRTFPILKRVPDLHFNLFLPAFMYKKRLLGAVIQRPEQNQVHFMMEGEIQLSKTVGTGQVKVCNIVGQQMFELIGGVDLIRVNTESARLYSISKSELEGLIAVNETGDEEFQQTFLNAKCYNERLKNKACEFYDSTFKNRHNQFETRDRVNQQISPEIRRSFQRQNIFTKQFNTFMQQTDEKKGAILHKLMEKSQGSSYLYQYKSPVKTLPDMKPIKTRAQKKVNDGYQRIRLHNRRQSGLLAAYKDLVKSGLATELSVPKEGVRRRRKIKNSSVRCTLPNVSNLVPGSKFNIYDILNKYP